MKYLPGKVVFENTEHNWGAAVCSDFTNSGLKPLGALYPVQICFVAFGDLRFGLINVSLFDAAGIVLLLLLVHERVCKLGAAWQESQVVAK